MDPRPLDPAPTPGLRRHVRRRLRRDATALSGFLCAYVGLAYLIVPAWWRHHERGRVPPGPPAVARTGDGIPGDPLNVALVGTQDEVVRALLTAGWFPADPITMRTSLGICKSVLLHRPYPDAPVSNLYVGGRRQDLAFQQQVGHSPRQRHHVRFWHLDATGADGRYLWVGAATFDRSVGFAHTTGQITHHIDADVDAERDKVFEDLRQSGLLAETYREPGVGLTWQGRNGGGDRYYTDGDRVVGVLAGGAVEVAGR